MNVSRADERPPAIVGLPSVILGPSFKARETPGLWHSCFAPLSPPTARAPSPTPRGNAGSCNATTDPGGYTGGMMLERFFAIAFLAVALSHIVQPRMWADFFAALRKTGYAGLAIAMFTLPQGLAIVVWHNVWVWDLPVLLTVAGWGMTLKSVNYMLNPKFADRMIEGPGASPRGYIAGGFILLILGGALGYQGFFR